jgi:hypothetical protein
MGLTMRYQSFFISLCVVLALLIFLIPGVNAATPQYTFQWAIPSVDGIHAQSGIAYDTISSMYTRYGESLYLEVLTG